jgi:hypothetical protein
VPALDLVVSPTLVASGEQVTAAAAVPGTPTVAVVDWGDGSTCNTTTGTECALTSAGFEGYHVYESAGAYPVHLQVIYPAGTLQDTFESVVVHDGAVRRVAGAGLFFSEPGSVAGDPNADGYARFRLTARYWPGWEIPAGRVRLTIPAAGVVFQSTQFSWLAAGPEIAKLSGEGTFNGSAGYGFTLWAFDAHRDWSDEYWVDRIRIRIWDQISGQVVYDSACTIAGCAAGDSDLVTDMAELLGWIVIHRDYYWYLNQQLSPPQWE